jgi:hypothetical protein
MRFLSEIALTVLFAVVPARAGNIVTDPGFESCSSDGQSPPPGWTASLENVQCNSNQHSGNFSAEFVSTTSTLSQSLTTIAGDNYDFSFWLYADVGSPNSFTASFGSDEVLDLANSDTFASYELEDFTVTATGTTTPIEFTGASDGGAWFLDDVSVTDEGPATPEPASVALFGSGPLGLCWFRRGR